MLSPGLASAPPATPERIEIAHDLARCVAPRQPRDPAARMRTGTAQIEIGDGHAVVGITKHGAGREQLVEAQLTMEDVAIDEAKAAFQNQGREDLTPKHAG